MCSFNNTGCSRQNYCDDCLDADVPEMNLIAEEHERKTLRENFSEDDLLRDDDYTSIWEFEDVASYDDDDLYYSFDAELS